MLDRQRPIVLSLVALAHGFAGARLVVRTLLDLREGRAFMPPSGRQPGQRWRRLQSDWCLWPLRGGSGTDVDGAVPFSSSPGCCTRD